MKSFKIVADSSADLTSLTGVEFESVPLKIITTEREFCDDSSLDVSEMVSFLYSYKGKSSTSCPNPEDWISAFGDAENVFCITITSTLSGCHNAALIAKSIYEEKYPERRVFVLDSLSTGPEMKLIIEKAVELAVAGKSFEEVCEGALEYSKKTALFFLLKSMKNLANNGRVGRISATAAGLLGIRVLGKASDKGDLEPLDKCRGRSVIFKTIISRMKENGYCGGRVRIANCRNEEEACILRDAIIGEFPQAEIEIYPARGLCSFYAENGGLLIGFEK
ncbi:MAG: DegV family protein [Oscillospiraceae bacterium]|nr:DegV family protein [Oscillospiraceae bacterium]